MADMTCIEVQRRLQAAHRAIGGRFTLTLENETAYLNRWYLPENCAFEDTQGIARGSLQECFAALDRYVAERSSALMAAE